MKTQIPYPIKNENAETGKQQEAENREHRVMPMSLLQQLKELDDQEFILTIPIAEGGDDHE